MLNLILSSKFYGKKILAADDWRKTGEKRGKFGGKLKFILVFRPDAPFWIDFHFVIQNTARKSSS